ncbi:D-alanyl-D-alanine carboxypeptidase family protein [Streptomyces achromogenes]|uniref:D-alanyl-D-alanine carboxypeptidase family protein n=1 Tax=Streptomyces achromogenes TaxID=67255 RepID=UPI0036F87BB1
MFTAARAEALWHHGQLIGLTSGYRVPPVQQRLFANEVRRTGSPAAARMLVLPPEESRHVEGTALDVRPSEDARWLEEHSARYGLYPIYDNEWWHFEYHPDANARAARPIRPAMPCKLVDQQHAGRPDARQRAFVGRKEARTGLRAFRALAGSRPTIAVLAAGGSRPMGGPDRNKGADWRPNSASTF